MTRNYLPITLGLIILCGALYLLSPILTPFLFGALLAYLANPLVNKLMRFKISRFYSVVIIFLFIILLLIISILLIIPLIQEQLNVLAQTLPNIIEWFQNKALPAINARLGSKEIINSATVKKTIGQHWTSAGNYVGVVLNTIVRSGVVLLDWVMNLLIIPVVMFYLLCDWDQMVMKFRNCIPPQHAPTIIPLVKESDEVLAAFFRGQLMVMLFIGVFYSIGLSLIGLNIGVIIGLILGIISIVPYLGVIVGLFLATIAALVQFGTFSSVLWVWGLFAIGQTIDTVLITPKFMGDQIGLHPIMVIFALLAGGTLFGMLGILLALPVAAVLMVWFKFLIHRYQVIAQPPAPSMNDM